MKITIWVLLMLTTTSYSYSQGLNDTIVYDDIPLNKYIYIDTMTFELGEYVSTINRPNNIYVLTNFLKRNSDLFVDIILEKNIVFDTTTQHFQKISCQSIIDDLFYFNVSSNQYRIRDTIVKSYSSNIAERRVRLKINRNRKYEYFLTLLENYKFENISEEELLRNIAIEQISNENSLALSKNIFPLIGKHYAKYLRSYEDIKFLNERNEIVYGKVYVDTIESDFYEDNRFDGVISVTSISDSTTYYSSKISDVNHLTYNPYFKKALDDFLGYDFNYKVDGLTNIPSDIVPKGKTKENLEILGAIFDLDINDSFKGSCHGHVFWGFEWIIKSPYSIKRILYDQYDNSAYIEYYSKYSNTGEVQYDMYERVNDEWRYKTTINHEVEKTYNIHVWILLLGILILILFIVRPYFYK